MSFVEKLQAHFIQKKWTLAVAESCTGGRLAAEITAIAGCSDYFKGGVIVYDNALKKSLLNISDTLLQEAGAVSLICVQHMAASVQELCQTTYGLAISGIAGPAGGQPDKPVGTVCFAIASPKGVASWQKHFEGNRQTILMQATQEILTRLAHDVLPS